MPQQVITATAFLHRDGKLFVAKRADTKKLFPGIYELPGGHIEFGEHIVAGLARELREEFVIEVIVNEPFYVFDYVTRDGQEHIVEIVYFAALTDPGQEPKLNPEDHTSSAWINADEVAKYFAPDDGEGQAALKGFAIINN
jgi:ADP-ribose pyrophosphatase YjhB (NUDIX family)